MKIEFIPLNDQARATPPEPIKRHLPVWYKEMSNTIDGKKFNAQTLNQNDSATVFTVKRCVPFSDILMSGYLLRFHTDILVDPILMPDGVKVFGWRYKGGAEAVGTHNHKQMPFPIGGLKHEYIKFNNPWVIKTPAGYSCLLMQPFDIENKNYTLLPAIVDTDTYDNAINFPGYVTADSDFKIDCGDPLMWVFPFKRDEWKMEIASQNFEPNKSNALLKMSQVFENAYRNFFHSKKRYD